MMDWRVSGLLLAAMVLAAGCGGPGAKSSPAKAKTSTKEGSEPSKAEIKHYEITELDAVDEPLQRSLDGGRLEIRPPVGWGFFPQRNYEVVFAAGKVSELPRLTVAAAESPYGGDDTTEDNASELAKKILRRLEKEKLRVREKPKPVKLGSDIWVRHVRLLTQSGTPCTVQSLQIVREGRLYTLELFAAAKDDSSASLDASVTKFRKTAYAVAANARFMSPGGSTASPPPAPEEKPVGTPAEKPAEEEPKPPATEKPAEASPDEKKTE